MLVCLHPFCGNKLRCGLKQHLKSRDATPVHSQQKRGSCGNIAYQDSSDTLKADGFSVAMLEHSCSEKDLWFGWIIAAANNAQDKLRNCLYLFVVLTLVL